MPIFVPYQSVQVSRIEELCTGAYDLLLFAMEQETCLEGIDWELRVEMQLRIVTSHDHPAAK